MDYRRVHSTAYVRNRLLEMTEGDYFTQNTFTRYVSRLDLGISTIAADNMTFITFSKYDVQ